MAAVIDLDRACWASLVSEALACAADPSRPPATLYSRAGEAEARPSWPSRQKGDGHVCGALLQLAYAWSFVGGVRRAALRAALAALAGDVAELMGPPPEAGAGQAELALGEPAEAPAWTRRADCGTGAA